MEEAAGSLQELVDGFENNPLSARKAMEELLARDPQQFHTAGLEVLKTGRPTPAHAYLVALLIENEILPGALSDLAKFSLEEAVALAKTVSHIDPLLDTKLARWLLRRMQMDSSTASAQVALRILGILKQISSGNRLTPMLVQLLRAPDPVLRSEVALLMGRGTKSVGWALSERDPRVRANAVEAAWGSDSRHTRGFLWELTKDSHNRVVGNALLALFQLGETASVAALLKMAAHASPMFRATAAWVMGQTQDACFLEALDRMEADSDEHVRRNASQAIARINQPPK